MDLGGLPAPTRASLDSSTNPTVPLGSGITQALSVSYSLNQKTPCSCIYIYTYIYIYVCLMSGARSRRDPNNKTRSMVKGCVSVYIDIYIYICIHGMYICAEMCIYKKI